MVVSNCWHGYLKVVFNGWFDGPGFCGDFQQLRVLAKGNGSFE